MRTITFLLFNFFNTPIFHFIDAIIDFLDMFFNRIDNEMYEKAVRVNKTGVKKKVKKIEEPKKNELFM